MQTRGEDITPNPRNKTTQRRRALKHKILTEANGDEQAAYQMAMSTLENYIPRLQEFVLSHSEEPAPEIPDLISQVFQLRMHDVRDVSDMLDMDTEQSLVHLDQQEDSFERENGYCRDEFLGELFSPIQIAYSYMHSQKNSFAAEPVISGAVNLIGQKVNSATLKRAAAGKPAGVLGAVSTGGTSHYDALRNYFRNNPEIAKQVISGQITDESQLPNWRAPINTNTGGNPLTPLVSDAAGSTVKEYLPYIIVGFIVIVAVVYFAAHSKK